MPKSLYLIAPARKLDVFGLNERAFTCSFIKIIIFDRRKVFVVGRFSQKDAVIFTSLLPRKTFRRTRKTFRRSSKLSGRSKGGVIRSKERENASKTRRSTKNGDLPSTTDFGGISPARMSEMCASEAVFFIVLAGNSDGITFNRFEIANAQLYHRNFRATDGLIDRREA